MPPTWDIICLSPNHWTGLPTSKRHLMEVFARERRVLFVEPPIDVFSALGRFRRWPKFRGLRKVARRVWVLSPLVVASVGGPARRAAYHRAQAARVRRAASMIGLRLPVAWCFAPEHVAYAGRLGEAALVYHVADEPTAVSGDGPVVAQLERDMLARSDVTFVVSRALYEARCGSGEVHRLPNAADRRHFARVLTGRADATLDEFQRSVLGRPEAPAEISGLRRPVALYGGAAYGWFDVDLLFDVAALARGWTFVLVGPLGRELRSRRLPPNVVAVGRKPYGEFPRYVAACDVAILPWRLDVFSRNADPIVLYEYLLCGKPVVATPVPAARERGELVATAETAEAFASALEKVGPSSRDPDVARVRIEFGFENTWERRADEARAVIERRLASASFRKVRTRGG